ncbi:organic hydroperoxide resistance protein [Acuticoccus mangrovi]|uniref:organic hydroperoxide resistance protein n=1 Tax=Acuticoccus mangrovi TaxID=2796142 RepID=UPI0038CC1134
MALKTLYTAEALVKGGRTGTAVSSDGALDVTLVKPKEMGGPGVGGTNPEQLFAAGYAACFLSALAFLAAQAKQETGDVEITSRVAIGPNEDKPGFGLAVAMAVKVPGLPAAEADALIAKAHEICPYSNATRGNIPVEITRVD